MELIERIIGGSIEAIKMAHQRRLKAPSRFIEVRESHSVFRPFEELVRIVNGGLAYDEQVTDDGLAVRLDLGDPATLIFRTREDAEAALGDNEDPAEYHVAHKFKPTVLEPEANEVWMVGEDPFSKAPIRLWWRDDAAADPQLAPSARGDRWVGEKRVLGIYNTRLRSLSALRRAMAVVVPRVAEYRHLAELGCEMLRLPDGSPVWAGDLIKVQDHGTYVVMSIPHIDLEVEPEGTFLESDGGEGDDTHWRPSIYNLERLKPWTE